MRLKLQVLSYQYDFEFLVFYLFMLPQSYAFVEFLVAVRKVASELHAGMRVQMSLQVVHAREQLSAELTWKIFGSM